MATSTRRRLPLSEAFRVAGNNLAEDPATVRRLPGITCKHLIVPPVEKHADHGSGDCFLAALIVLDIPAAAEQPIPCTECPRAIGCIPDWNFYPGFRIFMENRLVGVQLLDLSCSKAFAFLDQHVLVYRLRDGMQG